MPAASSSGFTMIEAIVTLSLVFILGGIALLGIYSARQRAEIQAAAETVAGFLRETAALATNTVKAQGCLPQPSPECSTYDVRFTVGARRYERQAQGTVNRGVTLTRELSDRARFGAGTPTFVTFTYAPPILAATPGVIRVEHAGDPTIFRCVRVEGYGGVEVFGPGPDCDTGLLAPQAFPQ